MTKETLVWNKILAAVLKMPGVRVNRVDFLTKALAPYCNEQKLSLLSNVLVRLYSIKKVVDTHAKKRIIKE